MPPTRPEPHQAREVAESFGVDPERYDRTRVRYPDALVERIVAGSPGPYVLDAGSGTGADQLAAILEEVGAAIDALGGSFTASYATVAVTAVRG